MDKAAESSEITMKLQNQVQKLVASNSLVKLARLKVFGINDDELSVPSGLNAVDTTKSGAVTDQVRTIP